MAKDGVNMTETDKKLVALNEIYTKDHPRYIEAINRELPPVRGVDPNAPFDPFQWIRVGVELGHSFAVGSSGYGIIFADNPICDDSYWFIWANREGQRLANSAKIHSALLALKG